MTPDLHASYFLAFTLDHDEDAAADAFTTRYGAPPEYVLRIGESCGWDLCQLQTKP